MSKEELASRDNWQTKSGLKALNAEKNLYKVVEKHF